MTKQSVPLQKRLESMRLPLPIVYCQEDVTGFSWQTIDDIQAQIQLADILVKKHSLLDVGGLVMVSHARLGCYETIEEEANDARISYVRSHQELIRSAKNVFPEQLTSLVWRLKDVEIAERRLRREYEQFVSSYARLAKEVTTQCSFDLVALCLPRAQEADLVIEQIKNLYESFK